MRFADVTGWNSAFTPAFFAMCRMKSMSYPTYSLVTGSTEPNGGVESFTPATSTPFFLISASVSAARAEPHIATTSASAAITRAVFLAIFAFLRLLD